MGESDKTENSAEQSNITDHVQGENVECGVASKDQQNETDADERAKWGVLSVLFIILVSVVIAMRFGSSIPIQDTRASVRLYGSQSARLYGSQEDMPLTQEYEGYLKWQEERQLAKTDMELGDIDEYVLREQKNIENWYAINLVNLKKWKKERLQQLESEEKIAWARYCQNAKNTVSETEGRITMNSYGTADTRIISRDLAVIDSYMRTDGHFSDTSGSYVVGDPAGIYEIQMRSIANAKNSIEMEFVKLEQKKKRYLGDVESLADRRRGGIYAKKRTILRSTRLKLQGGPGIIDAIGMAGNPLVMIEGEVFYEGDVVRGFKIRNISDYKVEFEKDGQILVQEID